ncbi:MAG: SAM-dependent methyltransferase [Gammaproteobacteria bacterium]|nr:MAG: SAM-dependent methyltransferase [Gammaproteobacteria bacterium]
MCQPPESVAVTALPPPDTESMRVSRELSAQIRCEMNANDGAISFARYMVLALYAPGLGYYAAGGRKFGPQGDFVTAPEISPLFSRCVARQVAQVLTRLGGGGVLEIGAGTGALSAVLLRELDALDCLPPRYLILEPSPDLAERQQSRLSKETPAGVTLDWLQDLPPPGFEGVVIANEVLDAFPAHRFRVTPEGFEEAFVGVDGDRFCWVFRPPTSPGLLPALETLAGKLNGPLPTPYISEIRLSHGPWVEELARRVQRGVVLLFDYGYPRHEYYHPQRAQGTLNCYYRHRLHDDPLILTGLQDISVHVDFTAVAEAASDFQVAGFTTQADFLIATGITEMVEMPAAVDAEALDLARQIRILTLPGEMGEVIKVMALTRDVDDALVGFALRDHRPRL